MTTKVTAEKSERRVMRSGGKEACDESEQLRFSRSGRMTAKRGHCNDEDHLAAHG